jgi:hypothetical protein
MPYLNLDLDYFTHPKTTRLIGLLGKGAEVLPIRLWCYCGKYHAEDGRLTGYSTQEIESLVGWWGDPGALIAALLKVRFLEGSEENYGCHDWAGRNGHIHALSERNRKVAQARWDKIKGSPTSGIPDGIPEKKSGIPQPTIHPTNQPTDQKQQQGAEPRTQPPTGKDLQEGKMDFETFIRVWWGPKEGNLSYPILVQFVQLGKQYGEAKVGEAIIQAANQNVRKLTYVRGILSPRVKERPVQSAASRTGETKVVGDLISKVLTFPCEDHPEILLADTEQCPKCFPKCPKCGEVHWIGETCEEWKARIPEIKKLVQS